MTEASHDPPAAGWRRLLPPWWTVFFPLLVMTGAAGWHAATTEGGVAAFMSGLLWPGSAAFGVVAVIVWLGWVLDID